MGRKFVIYELTVYRSSGQFLQVVGAGLLPNSNYDFPHRPNSMMQWYKSVSHFLHDSNTRPAVHSIVPTIQQ